MIGHALTQQPHRRQVARPRALVPSPSNDPLAFGNGLRPRSDSLDRFCFGLRVA
jgi:hypothetical protein